MFRRGRASLHTPDTIRRDLPEVRFLCGAVIARTVLKGKSSNAGDGSNGVKITNQRK